MKPSQVAARLRIIANKIDRSKNPSKVRVGEALRNVLAGIDPLNGDAIAQSGDPTQSGGYKFNLKQLDQSDDEHVSAAVDGMVSGERVSGTMIFKLVNGSVDGWDWKGDSSSFDITSDPEGIQQMVMDVVADFLGVE